MRRRLLPLALCGLAALSACAKGQAPSPASALSSPPAQAAAPQAAAQSQTAALVDQSARTLLELRKSTPHQMLEAAIAEARAIIVLPGIYQAGFLYSVHGGNGVLVARRADGGWSAPVFLAVGGAGYGPQVGLEKSRLVLAVMEDEMLARLLDNGLNFDATAKYDILGVREETGPSSLTEERPVLAFADGVGLMAGVALRGGFLTVSRELTRSYHGAAAGNAEEILKGTNAPGLETFALWGALEVAPEPAATRSGGIIRMDRADRP